MVHKVTLIPGDGIGPEVVNATVRVLEATGPKFEWETQLAGADAYAKTKQYIPKELYESIERTRLALKGPVTTPIAGGFASINVTLRKKFELFANFRPIKNLPGIKTHYPGVDLVIVRENTEGEYSGIEHGRRVHVPLLEDRRDRHVATLVDLSGGPCVGTRALHTAIHSVDEAAADVSDDIVDGPARTRGRYRHRRRRRSRLLGLRE